MYNQKSNYHSKCYYKLVVKYKIVSVTDFLFVYISVVLLSVCFPRAYSTSYDNGRHQVTAALTDALTDELTAALTVALTAALTDHKQFSRH